MSKVVSAVYARLRSFWLLIFRRHESEPVATPTPAPITVKDQAAESFGDFYFRGAILDQLDNYFKILRVLKRYDRDAYDTYSKLGASIVPEGVNFAYAGAFKGDADCLSPWFKQILPAFGAFFLGDVERETDRIHPSFCYLEKYDKKGLPPWVEHPKEDGAVYINHAFFNDGGLGYVTAGFPILLRPDGSERILRIRFRQPKSVRCKHGKDRGRMVSIPQDRWCSIHPHLEEWAKESLEKWPKNERSLEPAAFLRGLFIVLANRIEASAMSMVQVSASRAGMTAAFGVNIKRMPYFFKDRMPVITKRGTKGRIFHIVRPHFRLGKAVKMHFRGERSFEWNGYDIFVSVPGRHHTPIPEFDVGAVDITKLRGKLGFDMGQIATGLRAHVRGAPIKMNLFGKPQLIPPEPDAPHAP